MQTSLFIVLFFFASSMALAMDSNWLDNYQLTPLQINLLKRWQEEKKFNDEKLIWFAQSFERENLKPKVYVPPHTFDELSEVMHWAQGAAFATFAPMAGFTFDNETYRNDCPNWPLFNFGRATGTAYMQLDVLMLVHQTFSSLQIMYSHHPDTFREEFLKLAKSKGFDIYLTPAPST